jgi:hypothetical protein
LGLGPFIYNVTRTRRFGHGVKPDLPAKQHRVPERVAVGPGGTVPRPRAGPGAAGKSRRTPPDVITHETDDFRAGIRRTVLRENLEWCDRQPAPGAPGKPWYGMLSTIAVILVALWLLGLVSSYTMGGFIHILLVVAVVMILVRVINRV